VRARITNGVAIGTTIGVALFGGLNAISARQTPVVQPVDEKALREYTGVYQWGPSAFLYLQMWEAFEEFSWLIATPRFVCLHSPRRSSP
jgi:hypothetical protein